jgi:hypothetical protein
MRRSRGCCGRRATRGRADCAAAWIIPVEHSIAYVAFSIRVAVVLVWIRIKRTIIGIVGKAISVGVIGDAVTIAIWRQRRWHYFVMGSYP